MEKKFMDTPYTKEYLIGLACKIAANKAKEWRDVSDESCGWDHYEALRQAFKALADEYKDDED